MREIKKIEKFFLLALLRISIAGLTVILVTDIIFNPGDKLSIGIDVVILAACLLALVLRNLYYTASALIITGITLAAMIYQALMVPMNTTTSFSIILIVGFLFSILLTGPLMWTMHAITSIVIVVIFVLQASYPTLRVSPDTNDVITMGITYVILYFILSYCTGVLKYRYDRMQEFLRSNNVELINKTKEIESQNEELLQIQDSLNVLNADLESAVKERAGKISAQNEMLLKYTYTNAHHLRGPVARLLGLVAIQRLESNPNYVDFFNKIEDQANEIDSVVKQINEDLHANPPGRNK